MRHLLLRLVERREARLYRRAYGTKPTDERLADLLRRSVAVTRGSGKAG